MPTCTALACEPWLPNRANVLGLRARGISATHVPMGFARNLDAPLTAPDAVKDIDVLFFGV
jgi:hypothetical protein